MPASYPLLCAFIGENKGKQSRNTIHSWLSGICTWHTVNHAPWFGDDEWVQLARVSANKEGTKHKRPLWAPVSIKHLLALRHSLNISTPCHVTIWALTLCTFFGCHRLGELTITTAAAFDEKYHVLCSTMYAFLSFINLAYLLQDYVSQATQQFLLCEFPHSMDKNNEGVRGVGHSDSMQQHSMPCRSSEEPSHNQLIYKSFNPPIRIYNCLLSIKNSP